MKAKVSTWVHHELVNVHTNVGPIAVTAELSIGEAQELRDELDSMITQAKRESRQCHSPLVCAFNKR